MRKLVKQTNTNLFLNNKLQKNNLRTIKRNRLFLKESTLILAFIILSFYVLTMIHNSISSKSNFMNLENQISLLKVIYGVC